MSTEAYLVVGRIDGKVYWVESRPERSAIHGTMGDYGYTTDPSHALAFDSRSTADWHAARVFGFDGNRGEAVRASRPHMRLDEE